MKNPGAKFVSTIALLSGIAIGKHGVEYLRQRFKHKDSSVDHELVGVVDELMQCPGGRVLFESVATQQKADTGSLLKVRCMGAEQGRTADASWHSSRQTIYLRCQNPHDVKLGSLIFELLNAKSDPEFEAVRRSRDLGDVEGREGYARAIEAVEYKNLMRHHHLANECWPQGALDPSCCPDCPSACSRLQVDCYRCCLECGPCQSFDEYYKLANRLPHSSSRPDDSHAGVYKRQWDRW
eukprot:CAMPEP_0196584938 /NCGR_PEP_ID=MMETSP1081-20130531/49059_1 /TAXON_ID=36882 /ORGANISM="Pyramimonas amylifera, Strain CCMP720" /LENGTH=237 /DNA_ID=CAMNT_0041906327 /DNA_START=153 /DNA_END=863 /DNA_ORIENTATION=-